MLLPAIEMEFIFTDNDNDNNAGSVVWNFVFRNSGIKTSRD